MSAHRQDQGHVSDCIADIIQIGAEAAANIQPGSQYAIEVVHHIIENNQWNQITIPVFQEQ